MVRCPKCGQYQEDDSAFCGWCGLRLPPIQSRRTNLPQQIPQHTNPPQLPIPQTQKKNPQLFAAVIGGLAAVLLLAGMTVFFVVKSKTEKSNPSGGAAKDSLSAARESETADTEETDKKEDLQHPKDEVRTVGNTDADVNALETAYFDMNGVVDVQGQEVYLNLQDPVSVYAYNPDQEPVWSIWKTSLPFWSKTRAISASIKAAA